MIKPAFVLTLSFELPPTRGDAELEKIVCREFSAMTQKAVADIYERLKRPGLSKKRWKGL